MNPLSLAFGAAVAARNALYDHGVLPVRKLRAPVVSVGNISVGGSGKTPFVIALGELLKQQGVKFDVLSRGYGRNSSQVAVVNPKGMPEQFGDEPLLIARRLQVPVVVGADRYEAGRVAEETFDSQLHLLDDGFQHRRLARAFDIVLVSEQDLSDDLLPVGRLREPVSSVGRANAVVVSEEFAGELPIERVWRVRRGIEVPTLSLRDKGEAPSGPVVAFCGIARPERFFADLRGAGVQIGQELIFRDHHRYTDADIARLKRLGQPLVTTEKDEINLGGRLPVLVARVKMEIVQPDAVVGELMGAIDE